LVGCSAFAVFFLFIPLHQAPGWLSTHHSHSANLWAQNPQNQGPHHQSWRQSFFYPKKQFMITMDFISILWYKYIFLVNSSKNNNSQILVEFSIYEFQIFSFFYLSENLVGRIHLQPFSRSS
jgi:hypothetical protein